MSHAHSQLIPWQSNTTPYERALRGNIINICFSKFTQKDLMDTGVDVPELYRQVLPRIKRSKQPRVLLVMQHKFKAAAIVIMMERFGCQVRAAFSGRMAYTWYLKNHWQEFDLVICDWDLPDVNGRDLVYYNREVGGTLVFLALLPSEMNSADVVRGGADLFLRAPLWIHMHTLRELLLPNVESSYGYPREVMARTARHQDVKTILDQVCFVPDNEVNVLAKQVDEDHKLVEECDIKASTESLDKLIGFVKRQTESGGLGMSMSAGGGGADPVYVKQLSKALGATLDVVNKMKDDNVTLTHKLNSARAEHRLALTAEKGITMQDKVDPEALSRREFVAYFNMFRRNMRGLQVENDSLLAELERLAFFKVNLEEGLAGNNLTVRFEEVNLQVEQETLQDKLNGRPPKPKTVGERTGPVVMGSRTGEVTKEGVKDPSKLGKSGRLAVMATHRMKNLRSLRAKLTSKKVEFTFFTHEAVNRRLECLLMAKEDTSQLRHSKYVSTAIQPVSTETWRQLAPSLGFDHDTGVDAGILISVHNSYLAIINTISEEVNRLTAQVGGTHPILCPKLEAFAMLVGSHIKLFDLSNKFTDCVSWAHKLMKVTMESNREAVAQLKDHSESERAQRQVESRFKIGRLQNVSVRNAASRFDGIVRARYFRKWHVWIDNWHAEAEAAKTNAMKATNQMNQGREARTNGELRREVQRQRTEIEEAKHETSNAIRAKSLAEETTTQLQELYRKQQDTVQQLRLEVEALKPKGRKGKKDGSRKQGSGPLSPTVPHPRSPNSKGNYERVHTSDSTPQTTSFPDDIPQSPSESASRDGKARPLLESSDAEGLDETASSCATDLSAPRGLGSLTGPPARKRGSSLKRGSSFKTVKGKNNGIGKKRKNSTSTISLERSVLSEHPGEMMHEGLRMVEIEELADAITVQNAPAKRPRGKTIKGPNKKSTSSGKTISPSTATKTGPVTVAAPFVPKSSAVVKEAMLKSPSVVADTVGEMQDMEAQLQVEKEAQGHVKSDLDQSTLAAEHARNYIAALQNSLKSARQGEDRLREELQSQLAKATEDSAAHNKEVEGLKTQLEQVQGDGEDHIADLTERLSELTQISDSKKLEVKRVMAALNDSREATDATNQQLSQQLTEATKAAMENELEAQDIAAELLRAKIEAKVQNEEMAVQLSRATKEAARQNKDVSELRSALQNEKAGEQVLRQKLEELVERNESEAENHEKNSRELEVALTAAKQQEQTLKSRLKEQFSKATSVAMHHQKEVSHLEVALRGAIDDAESKTVALEERQRQASVAGHRLAELERDLAEQTSTKLQLQEMQNQLASMSAFAGKVSERESEVRRELESEKAQHTAARTQLDELQHRFEELVDHVAQLEGGGPQVAGGGAQEAENIAKDEGMKTEETSEFRSTQQDVDAYSSAGDDSAVEGDGPLPAKSLQKKKSAKKLGGSKKSPRSKSSSKSSTAAPTSEKAGPPPPVVPKLTFDPQTQSVHDQTQEQLLQEVSVKLEKVQGEMDGLQDVLDEERADHRIAQLESKRLQGIVDELSRVRQAEAAAASGAESHELLVVLKAERTSHASTRAELDRVKAKNEDLTRKAASLEGSPAPRQPSQHDKSEDGSILLSAKEDGEKRVAVTEPSIHLQPPAESKPLEQRSPLLPKTRGVPHYAAPVSRSPRGADDDDGVPKDQAFASISEANRNITALQKAAARLRNSGVSMSFSFGKSTNPPLREVVKELVRSLVAATSDENAPVGSPQGHHSPVIPRHGAASPRGAPVMLDAEPTAGGGGHFASGSGQMNNNVLPPPLAPTNRMMSPAHNARRDFPTVAPPMAGPRSSAMKGLVLPSLLPVDGDSNNNLFGNNPFEGDQYAQSMSPLRSKGFHATGSKSARGPSTESDALRLHPKSPGHMLKLSTRSFKPTTNQSSKLGASGVEGRDRTRGPKLFSFSGEQEKM